MLFVFVAPKYSLFGNERLSSNSKMENQQKAAKKRKRKRKTITNENNFITQSVLILPQIIASLAKLQSSTFAQFLLPKLLTHLHQSLNFSNTQTLICNTNFFFSLLPTLLRTTNSSPSIPRRAAEIIGAISLQSLESNQRISSDEEILLALLDAVRSSSKKVSAAACNAVLDVSTTSFGREKLCELHAVEKLISVFLQDAVLPPIYAHLCDMGKGSSYGGELVEDAFRMLVLDATVTLINACNVKQLSGIPQELLQMILSYMKASLLQLRDQNSQGERSKVRSYFSRNPKEQGLMESMFRLSSVSAPTIHICDKVKRRIFGPNQYDFEDFMLNCWEDSPVLLGKLRVPLDGHHDNLSSLVQSFKSKQINDVLSCTLEGLVGCPPLPSDELDILNFLKDMKDELGHPIIYGQDIRVVKSVEGISGTNKGNLKREVYFLKDRAGSSCISGHDLVNIGDVQKCEEAYQEGYTIALRGMEFRSRKIASVANDLAVLFGQPSVGANTYLTPPTSQGLARHYDDHCVFVCQLHGKKKWSVFPRSTLQLPRLYEPLDSVVGCEDVIPDSKCDQFLLEEGDVLYIPRGCPHEACTVADEQESNIDEASINFSFHLTLGIEIEPPFEWEGFAHVALHSWNQNTNKKLTPLSSTMASMSINLLHIAIHNVASIDPIFAKACILGAFSSSQSTHQSNLLLNNYKTTFTHILNKIDKDIGFLKALKIVAVVVEEKNDDMFQRMAWLRHLYPEGGFDWEDPLSGFEEMMGLVDENRVEAEGVFMEIKSRFCREVVLEDVIEEFVVLLEKYRRVRKQYMDGMLSLHCNAKIY